MLDDPIKREILLGLIRFGLLSVASYFAYKWLFSMIDPTNQQKSKAKKKAWKTLTKVGKSEFNKDLNEYELMIASQLISPDEIDVSWKDIAGLDNVIDELRETVILPLQVANLSDYSRLFEPPKGVLLYGPPGVGKTMVAKATAKEAKARFINLDISILTDKWYGESQKLAAAVFTLAIKIQPTIIFIDEIDSFLRQREAHDHEATSMMKAQFMVHWDGLISNKYCAVVVIGATNRPSDVDVAIRRRMPSMFHISFPNVEQRKKILNLILEKESVDSEVDLDKLALECENFSGSDLKELCRQAAMKRIKGFYQKEGIKTCSDLEEFLQNIRPINDQDFKEALEKIKTHRMNSPNQNLILKVTT
ncbi:ATPase family AAA domain-containing protein 1-B [Sarcoptes scabiei]|uniref:ATPase family AAA domain-containing protein 1-B n=1 Tax=Sarcoptes scabiei TaxID=52283 RepID=A0A834VD46_SARSC|nr:ATPase family AAA domain-containing protein 1-B [Sarcoptes scabiei]